MTVKTTITKSRSGHYTACVREGRRLLFKATRLPSLFAARRIAAKTS